MSRSRIMRMGMGWIPVLLAGAPCLFAATTHTPLVTLAGCPRVATPPTLDGVLDDACWKEAGEVTPWFDFAGGKSGLRTELKLACDGRAMYLAVFCHESDPSKIRARVSRRQDMDLWTDDCLEIYVSPTNTGSSHLKFTVNSIGTQMDLMMDEENKMLTDWRPEAGKKWRVAAKQTGQGWVAEVEIPWSDIGCVPRPGDVWSFAAIRFSWVTGSYVACKTAPGVQHGHKEGFGYVVFGSDISRVLKQVQAALKKRENADTWELDLPRGTIYRFQPYGPALRQLLQEVQTLSNECRSALTGLRRDDARSTQYRALETEMKKIAQDLRSSSEPGCAEWRTSGDFLADLKTRLVEFRMRLAVASLLPDK